MVLCLRVEVEVELDIRWTGDKSEVDRRETGGGTGQRE